MIILTLLVDSIIVISVFVLNAIIYAVNIDNMYLMLLLVSIISMYILFYILNVYTNTNIYAVSIAIIKTWVVIALIISVLIFLIGMGTINGKIMFTWVILAPIALIITKLITLRYLKRSTQTIYVYGNDYIWTEFELARLKKHHIKLIAIDNITQIKDGETVVINSKEDIVKPPNLNAHYLSIAYFMEYYLRKCHIEHITELEHITGYTKAAQVQKYVIDYILIIIILPIFIISSIVTMVCINMQSSGKIFFRQNRVGKFQKVFKLFKFRSMHENAYFDPYTQENDVRIFPYGRFMRKLRIDELPQLINILKGDMSVIGPRAEWDILAKQYNDEITYYSLRSLVKPGITGWAQVNYPYGSNVEDTKQKLMYDFYYIKHWSFALELEIIVKTIKTIMHKKGL